MIATESQLDKTVFMTGIASNTASKIKDKLFHKDIKETNKKIKLLGLLDLQLAGLQTAA